MRMYIYILYIYINIYSIYYNYNALINVFGCSFLPSPILSRGPNGLGRFLRWKALPLLLSRIGQWTVLPQGVRDHLSHKATANQFRDPGNKPGNSKLTISTSQSSLK